MRLLRLHIALLLSLLVGSASLSIAPAEAARVRSTSGPLVPLWAALDAGRLYRCFSLSGGRCQRNSYTEMLNKYLTASTVPAALGRSPQDVFLRLGSVGTAEDPGFAAYLSVRGLAEEALWGVQEALNEYMAGQTLIANDRLLKGLNARFPGVRDPSDPDQLTLLSQSVDMFQLGIDAVVERLRQDPGSLRVTGDVNPTFPFWVENTRVSSVGQGDVVENELYRFTDLVQRGAIARNSVGKRKFFFENDTPNGRDEAAVILKQSAQATYLHTAVLAAVESRRDFFNNNGHELKRQVIDAERVFSDILAGLNPLALRGDFVPAQPFETLLSNFNLALNGPTGAVETERGAQVLQREFDTDQTALQSELRNQQQGNLTEISSLSGLTLDELRAYDILDADSRDALVAESERRAILGRGVLGQRNLAVREAAIAAQAAYEELRQIPEKIRIEEERNRQVASVTTSTGEAMQALTIASAVASSIEFVLVGSPGVAAPIPQIGRIISAFIGAQKDLLQTMQSVAIGGINSAATIKNLLLQGATAFVAAQRAEIIIKQRQAEFDEARAQLQRAIRNYMSARTDFATAYFSNPAYRLQLDRARENAEKAFEAAMVSGYIATKGLEYEWAERLSNPILRLDGGLPETIGDVQKFNPIVSAESVFAVRSAGTTGSPEHSLATYREALQLWDSKMRSLRSPATQSGFTTTVSVRKKIRGLVGGDEAFNRAAFAAYIAENRVEGANPSVKDLELSFAIQVADQFFFPAQPNLKIESIKLNLKSRPGRSLRGPGAFGNPALVELVMLDEAQVRTFFDDPGQPDVLHIDLEGARTLQRSPFYALAEAAVDGFPSTIAPNTQLENRSPAVSRWVLRIDMSADENRYLLLENLDDIEITFTYKFGRPRQFQF